MKRMFGLALAALVVCFEIAGIDGGQTIPRVPSKRIPPARSARPAARRLVAPEPARWVRNLRLSGDVYSMAPSGDGGLVVSGNSVPLGWEPWLLKLDSTGAIEWAGQATGTDFMYFYSLVPVPDGNLLAVGSRGYYGFGAAAMKFTPTGDVLWSYMYGGASGEKLLSIAPAADGGYIAAGAFTRPLPGGDPYDYSVFLWVLKLGAQGTIQWETAFECLDVDQWDHYSRDISVIQAADGGYLAVANTALAGAGIYDYLVIKLDAAGQLVWQKTFGGPHYDSLYLKGPHIQAAADGGCIVAGSTSSFGMGHTDAWALKLDPAGDIEWQKAYGTPGYEYCNSIRATGDGGYIMAGDGSSGYWLAKLSPGGDLEWQKLYQGAYAELVAIAPDGGYFLAGEYGDDTLVMRLSAQGVISGDCGFVRETQAVVTETTAVAAAAFFPPVAPASSSQAATLGLDKSLDIKSELVCWNLNQPPIPASFSRSVNRGLFRGEAINTIIWEPNPANAGRDISQYRIYRKIAANETEDYALIASVSGSRLAYADQALDMAIEYLYVLTSVDAQGHESPRSVPIGPDPL